MHGAVGRAIITDDTAARDGPAAETSIGSAGLDIRAAASRLQIPMSIPLQFQQLTSPPQCFVVLPQGRASQQVLSQSFVASTWRCPSFASSQPQISISTASVTPSQRMVSLPPQWRPSLRCHSQCRSWLCCRESINSSTVTATVHWLKAQL
eukprot:TRINITY_DN36463_c0_g1_i1.p1 TRINITY_DN36463_c0_g1~~TRINITY_DN36463_c0_g1_i1.p1  ORF type:complete len:151 (+),score=14.95 TRINITY_DN36463_c0_g1_i1:82-534(+)